MIINIHINKDLEVKVEIDDELINKKKPKWEFWIQKKWAWEKVIEEITKEAKENNIW